MLYWHDSTHCFDRCWVFFSLLPTCSGQALNLHIRKFWTVCLTSNHQWHWRPLKVLELKDCTWIRHMEPRRVGHGVQVDVSPRREAVAVGLWGQDVGDGQQEADQPGSAHAEQSLRRQDKGRSLGDTWSHHTEPLTVCIGAMKHVRDRKQKHFYASLHPRGTPCCFMRSVPSYHGARLPIHPPSSFPLPPFAAAAAQCFRNTDGLFLVYVRLCVFDLQAFIHYIF